MNFHKLLLMLHSASVLGFAGRSHWEVLAVILDSAYGEAWDGAHCKMYMWRIV